MARLKQFYKDSVVKKMTEQFGYTSVMQVPRIEKITLNMGRCRCRAGRGPGQRDRGPLPAV